MLHFCGLTIQQFHNQTKKKKKTELHCVLSQTAAKHQNLTFQRFVWSKRLVPLFDKSEQFTCGISHAEMQKLKHAKQNVISLHTWDSVDIRTQHFLSLK